MSAAAFHERNVPHWQRLDVLVRRLGPRTARSLSLEEVAELGRLYRKATADLAKARTLGVPDATVRWLNELCGRAHGRIYRRRARTHLTLRALILRDLPRLLWESRRAALGGVGALALGGIVAFVAVGRDPSLASLVMPEDGSGMGCLGLAALALTALLGGLFLGVGSFAVLAWGGAGMGAAFALARSPSDLAWGAVAHAPLGLLAAVIAGAVGFRLGWSLVEPGALPRREAFAEKARGGGPLLALGGLLLLAGLVLEYTVSRPPLPLWAKGSAGLLSATVSIAYCLLGRKPCASA